MNINLTIPTVPVNPISSTDYPPAGTGEQIGCLPLSPVAITKIEQLNAGSSSSSTFINSFLRVNSYSSCVLSDNTVLIAVASQHHSVLTLPPSTDPVELAQRESAQVNIIESPLGNYAAATQRGRIAVVDVSSNDCTQGVIDIEVSVDPLIWADTKIKYIWPLDGDLAGIKFNIVSRTAPNIWRILPSNQNVMVNLTVGHCFRFIPYGNVTSGYPAALNKISPLPYIMVNGLAVGAVNPQIASNDKTPPGSDKFVYVVAEAPVGGAYQLFFYSFRLGVAGDYDLFGWTQLTYDGENRNAKIKVDGHGNLHVAWESNRCKPGQIYYGIIGPSSRAVINEVFASAVDKWVEQGGTNTPITISNPTAMNLRQIDEYDVHFGNFWNSYTMNGGVSSIIADDTLTLSGIPKTQKFSAFACLTRDEHDNYFDGMFSQLSYQISFNLEIDASTESFDQFDISDEYVVFKQTFVPVETPASNINVYSKNGKYYTIGEPQVIYEKLIPLIGAYKAPGMCGIFSADPYTQIALRHYMIAAVPEKVRFTAKSTQGLADISEEYYTGQYKFAIVFETSANISDRRVGSQKHHWVRLFGEPTTFNAIHNYKIAVHYSHLREEGVDSRVLNETILGTDNSVRFSGDIIISVDGVPILGETFVPDFSDSYHQFDLGFGCAIVGEFRTALLSAYDGSTNDSLPVTLKFTSIAVGPHSVLADPYNTFFAPTDRLVSSMVVATDANEITSLTAAQEAWSTENTYELTLGLNRQKFGLSQVPITFLGTNTCPSIAVNGCETPNIAYQSNRDGDWEIYYTGSVQSGLPLRFDTRITDYPGMSLCPAIAIDNLGKKLITWHDNRTGQYQIFSARSTTVHTCDDGWCDETALDDLGTNPVSMGFDYDAYLDSPYYGSSCVLTFEFTNSGKTAARFHFRANFFTDVGFTSYFTDVDSRFSIAQWQVNGIQLEYDGVFVLPQQTVTVSYYPSEENNIFGQLYYVEIEADNGITISPLDKTILYFCPISQLPICTIPIVFTNTFGTSKQVHFRVTVYRDYALTQPVFSASTQNDITRWISGSESFPTSGITVAAHNVISVVYNPQFLPLGLENDRNPASSDSLLCNVNYYVVTEAYVNSSYSTIETFAILCNCQDVNAQLWRKDFSNNEWICSGQTGMDIRITDTDSLALFPSVSASDDGVFYIAWEDRRLSSNQSVNQPYAYWAVWDARSDVFYCSAQGYKDREIAPFNRFHPLVLVNHMQNPSFVVSDGQIISTRLCSLYVPLSMTSSSSSSSFFSPSGLFNENQLPMDTSCMSISVYAQDAVSLFHQDSNTPIAQVSDCKIRFEVVGPYGAYAVRFMNENESQWSPWLSVLPTVPYSSSSSATLTAELNGFSLSPVRFVIPWILSRGNGNKTVSCQILTPNGTSPTISTNIIAIYKELTYKVLFFKDAAMTVPASDFNGTPVLSTNVLTINASDVTSLSTNETTSPTIYIQVTFDDIDRLQRLLDLAMVDKFSPFAGPLTFDVYTQGFNRYGLPLSGSSGIYTGKFDIAQDDGIDNLDGLAVVVVNTPTPCSLVTSSSSAFCNTKNVSPSDIIVRQQNDLAMTVVELEPFKYIYNQDLLCSFPSNTCFASNPIYTESLNDTAAAKPPIFIGSVQCNVITWISPKIAEKGFYQPNGGTNAPDWTVTSPVFSLDFSDSRIDYLQFLTSKLDDVLILIREDENVTTTTSLTSSSSSSTAGGGIVSPTVVTFSVPQGSVIFAATDGYYCHGPSDCNSGSAEKIFVVSITRIADIPAGTISNNGTGNISLFPTLPWAEGVNAGSLLSSSSSGSFTNCLRTTFSVGVSTKELLVRGFISSNGVLRFKLVHIPSGVGFANIAVTCGASCFLSSSSSH